MSFVFLIGPAGSGKTTVTKALAEYLRETSEKVAIVNLDPGVIYLPYKADYDIRELVDLRELMIRERLGPNGGLLRAHEIMLENIHQIIQNIHRLALVASYVLIDTPGQLELFALKEIGSKVMSFIRGRGTVGIFIVDGSSIKKPSDVVMNMLLALAVKFHLDIELAFVLNKIDIAEKKAVQMFDQFLNDPEAFHKHLSTRDTGVFAELSEQLLKILRDFLPPTRLIAISALQKRNIDDLYSIIHDTLCECGDLT
ncbi:MAG: ATP/GTP-binding protein [Candidatus Njordarchaeales archaeon]